MRHFIRFIYFSAYLNLLCLTVYMWLDLLGYVTMEAGPVIYFSATWVLALLRGGSAEKQLDKSQKNVVQ